MMQSQIYQGRDNSGQVLADQNDENSQESGERENGESGTVPHSMKELLNLKKFQLPKRGEFLDGTVLSVSRTNVLVDLGALGTGIVYPGEFFDSPERQKALRINDAISVMLLTLENENGGYREVSLRAAQQSFAWRNIRKLYEEGAILELTVGNFNKGGLMVEVEGVNGFVPLSQLSDGHYPKVEGGDTTEIVRILQTYRNQPFRLKIIDLNESEGKLILSEKAVLNQPAVVNISGHETGQIVSGVVAGITDFGVFVRMQDGNEGLIPVSDLDWGIVDDPRTFLKEGNELKAQIISIDNQRITLSLKALQPDPWPEIKDKFEVGQTLQGKLVRLDVYGARVEVAPKVIALAPTSEFGSRSLKEMLQLGQIYSFAVVEFDPGQHKMILTPVSSLLPDAVGSVG